MSDLKVADVMEFLYMHKASNLPPDALADVFDRLIWCLDDNGESITQVQEKWLRSGDRGRVEIALAMDEVFPFKDAVAMTAALDDISSRWPELGARCEQIKSQRMRGHSG
jgi:hypothetical protein